MAYSKEKVLEALKHVIDPDLKKDLVSLNMISDVKVEGKNVSFTIIFTTPACPLKESIKRACIDAVHKFVGEDTNVTVNFSSSVTSKRTKEKEEILKGVKNIIAIASGKGGVGAPVLPVNLVPVANENKAVSVNFLYFRDTLIFGRFLLTIVSMT